VRGRGEDTLHVPTPGPAYTRTTEGKEVVKETCEGRVLVLRKGIKEGY
jgi:hypothetical protein